MKDWNTGLRGRSWGNVFSERKTTEQQNGSNGNARSPPKRISRHLSPGSRDNMNWQRSKRAEYYDIAGEKQGKRQKVIRMRFLEQVEGLEGREQVQDLQFRMYGKGKEKQRWKGKLIISPVVFGKSLARFYFKGK